MGSFRYSGLMNFIDIEAGGYALSLCPDLGGSIASFTWRGHDIMRRASGPGVLDSGCFALVPFSNRIAASRFTFAGREVVLSPNHPDAPGEPVLHGFGWLDFWSLAEAGRSHAVLVHDYAGGEWPWAYRATATFELGEAGLLAGLALENLGADPMPAGLGFHPYFPLSPGTLYRGMHRGEWQVGADCLPRQLAERTEPADWWDGQPVATRAVDTVYTGREAELKIAWPTRGLRAVIEPSADLSFTTVYVPPGENFFCVEPVSHATDAFNHPAPANGMRVLEPGEAWTVSMRVRAEALC